MTQQEIERLDFEIDTRATIVTPDVRRVVKEALRLMKENECLKQQVSQLRASRPTS